MQPKSRRRENAAKNKIQQNIAGTDIAGLIFQQPWRFRWGARVRGSATHVTTRCCLHDAANFLAPTQCPIRYARPPLGCFCESLMLPPRANNSPMAPAAGELTGPIFSMRARFTRRCIALFDARNEFISLCALHITCYSHFISESFEFYQLDFFAFRTSQPHCRCIRHASIAASPASVSLRHFVALAS